MKIIHRWKFGTIVMLVGMLLLIVGAAACSGGDSDAVDLLEDPKVGLAHLNEELHTIRGLATDPKLGFEHLNAELHTLKELLADLTEQVTLLGSPDPVAIYQDMGAKMASITSSHMLVTFEVEEGSWQFEVEFLAPDRVRYIPVGDSWFDELLGIGDRAYFRFPGFQGWILEEEEEGFSDLPAFLSAVYTKASDLTYIGKETLGEVPVHHVQGTLGGDLLRLVDPEDKDDSATADFWIGTDDSLLYQMRGEESPSGEVSDWAFSAFNVPVIIEAPAKAISGKVIEGLERRDVSPHLLGELVSILPSDTQACLRDHLGEKAYSDLAAGVGSIGFTEYSRCLASIF